MAFVIEKNRMKENKYMMLPHDAAICRCPHGAAF